MKPSSAQAVEWRFGGRPEDVEAWCSAPSDLHVYVDVRTEETPPGCWYRVWGVTKSWVLQNVMSGEWAIVPPLIVIADGNADAMRASVDQAARSGALLITGMGTLLESGHTEEDW